MPRSRCVASAGGVATGCARANAEATAESGDAAIVPGNPAASSLIARIESKDESTVMPPPKSHKRLSALQKERLKRWIAEGAKYELHWAFAAVEPVALPAVNLSDWVRTPIDRFILARLEQSQLTPSPEADHATLLRRLSLDLTGLPPTLQDIEQFMNDRSTDAYERAVDRLLRSPHYGERLAVDWLDAARFADTNGYQVDRDRETSAWRDWVMAHSTTTCTFDQFTIEQLAGDLLPNATLAQRIATGFHRNHMMNEEGGIIPTSSWPNTRRIASRQRRRSGWDKPLTALAVTITSLTRSRSEISTV